MPPVSFAANIRPLFREMDVVHMKAFGVDLDDYAWMSIPANAASVLETVSPQNGNPPTMPPGGPYWTPEQIALYQQWQKDGYQP
jgi:hypothetical protein